MNTIILSLIGIAAILDVIMIFYIGPKTLSSENGSPFIWIPFSFFYKLFAFFSMFYLIYSGQANPYIIAMTVIYILGLYGVVRGWGLNLENPWTNFKMDKINIREGFFSPVHKWSIDGANLFLESFFDRVVYAFAIIFLTSHLLGLF
jgi:hypothetical protein